AQGDYAKTQGNSAKARVNELVNLVHLGEYNASTSYKKYNEVRYQGRTWRARKDVKNVTPAEGESWTLVADKGDSGSSRISQLTDVNLSALQNGYVLMYDQNRSEWIPVNPASL